MKYRVCAYVLFSFLYWGCGMSMNVYAATNISENALSDLIEKNIQNKPGHFAVYAAQIGKDPTVCINCDDFINAASTIKLAVIDAAYNAIKNGKLHLDDKIVSHNRFHSLVGENYFSLDQKEDSYDSLYTQIGKPVTVSELLRVMIQYSSNLATNLLIEKLGVYYIRDVLKKQDIQGVIFGRMIEDFDANDQDIKNLVTARGLGNFLQKLANGQIVGSEESQSIIRIMLGQKFNDIIPPLLPKNTLVAHKTGWVNGVRNDAAIITLPNNKKYILVMLSKNLPSEEKGIKTMNIISKEVYDYFK